MNNSTDIEGGALPAIGTPDGMTVNELGMLWSFFIYSNPQYYFLLNSYSYYCSDSENIADGIILRCYDAFCDGEARANATAKVKAQIQAWEAAVAGYTTDEEKVKVIFDLICNKVDYNYDAAAGSVLEQDSFSQSAYSVLCMDKTVCAGYSDTLTLMCNGAGIDAVAVTSSNHQWNKIRINDSWYNFDATWGDQTSGIYYGYYARNDYSYDTEGDTDSHQELDLWIPYLPKCTLDATPSDPWAEPGTYPEILNTTAAPEITATEENGAYLVTITSSTPNADIYYTVDGSVPSAAFGKATRYTAPFEVEGGSVVKAIAVCDSYFDSSVVSNSFGSEDVPVSIEETVILLDGMNPDSHTISYNYDRTQKKPVVTVMYGEDVLVEGIDYTVSYGNNMDAGTAIVTITGAGNYRGYVSKTFTINPASINNAEVTLSVTDYIYDGSEKMPVVTVKIGDIALRTGFVVSYDNNIEAGTATVIITGSGNYRGNISKTFTINPAPISNAEVTLSTTSYIYDGSGKNPGVTVKLGSKTLAKDTEYTVNYNNNAAAGTATVTITGTGNYSGTISKTFTVNKASINNAEVTLSATSYTYDGSGKNPGVTVKVGSRTLVSGIDYAVSYNNNTAVGTATVTITGTGNYSGTVSKTFTINKASIANATVTLSATRYTYDGSAKKPSVTVKVGNKTLAKDVDYTVSYNNNIAAGTATVTITGTGNYSGTISKIFTINTSLKNGWIQENGNWYYYVNGTAQTGWLNDGGSWYYMNPNGTMATGWLNDGGTWYYMNPSGTMATGWLNDGGTWYYMNADGTMVSGWLNDGGTWYYMNGSGAMATGWLNDGGTWYYMNAGGTMATGWLNDGGTWYYMNPSGTMATGWLNDGGTWYYMNPSGTMATGWINDGGTWYYMTSNGMATGWLNDGGTWYYFYPSGAMASNTWIGNYYVDASGAWAA